VRFAQIGTTERGRIRMEIESMLGYLTAQQEVQ
jgi:hypothetical protein